MMTARFSTGCQGQGVEHPRHPGGAKKKEANGRDGRAWAREGLQQHGQINPAPCGHQRLEPRGHLCRLTGGGKKEEKKAAACQEDQKRPCPAAAAHQLSKTGKDEAREE